MRLRCSNWILVYACAGKMQSTSKLTWWINTKITGVWCNIKIYGEGQLFKCPVLVKG